MPWSVRPALDLHEGDEILFLWSSHARSLQRLPTSSLSPAACRCRPRSAAQGGTTSLLRALEVFELERIDVAEAYLVAQAEATGVREILSFDRSIDRIASVARREPRLPGARDLGSAAMSRAS
jgi:hypothetical protein